MHTIRNVMAVAVVAALVGCNGASENTGSAADEQIGVTSVVLNRDGTRTVKETTITQEQFQAMVDARLGRAPAASAVSAAPGPEDVGTAAQAINEDPACAAPSLWLIDGASCSGSHMLCLQNEGGIALSTFGWGGVGGTFSVASYWPGSEAGNLSAFSNGTLTQDDFGSWGPCTDTSDSALLLGGYFWVNLTN